MQDRDRLLLSALVAVAVHAALILGVGFAREVHAPRAPGLDVTLAQVRDDAPDETADFLAQADQRGSGSVDEVSDPGSPVNSAFDAPAIRPVLEAGGSPPAATRDPLPTLTSTRSEQRSAARDAHERRTQVEAPAPRPAEASAEIASLVARLDAQQKAYARLPRVERLTSAATRAAADAAYLYTWKQRIETIGNQHYPVEARRRRLYGDLRLLVALRADGSVKEVRVLQSSGYALLDDAAMQIVRLSAPFEPFPPELRARADELEIIRTWQFRSNRLTSSE
ncbi:MAG: energy transducer TonB [Pseudomonadales bacterium]|nr:energy transducer TonB [Pseudomonadales bacterium]